MKQVLRENWEFVRQFRQRFHTTGAVLPSSRYLARAMTRPLSERSSPKRVLEVGPGTGAVTKYIVEQIGPEDRFDLVEINDRFAELLRHRFQHDPRYQPVAERAEIHVCPLQDFRSDAPYDTIISGLPFNNFSAHLVGELVDACFDLLAPGGTFSFFEYMYIRPLKCAVLRGPEQQRLQEIEQLLRDRFRLYRFKRDWVFVNVPPAWVQHLQREPLATYSARGID
ncbi:MAG: class I SAM-dependent methyltransferase [Planctomycetaceae bacterium]